mmetsp:Transcript_12288/g.28750  ORF Transcript_12288/g.28750 Transcript_12288/m.28750 type:complete len:218 (-) Transcript_12288:68-721(-)|eukprot:CAMPEP_0178404482 /NCGR_PEP_ID=MMETSP0689_2-20121128/17908_1 /TAXON_ID=160604 /ORGANISM="Amphidinium massartii, Strain CS-259" /LENGTH=217 /DNA_ID=CAMNT_0020025471 /DNA_START=63 /DNA_END=716 /DNA_ORIENTATION=-
MVSTAAGIAAQALESERRRVLDKMRGLTKSQVGFGLATKIFQSAHPELHGDRDVVLAAVSRDGSALQHASQNLRGDKEVVLTAVSESGMALEYASDNMRGEQEVVKAAVAANEQALEWAAPELVPELVEGSSVLQELFILKVNLLSGRSCLVVSRTGRRWRDVKKVIVRKCACKLGLTNESHRAELFFGTEAVPEKELLEWPGIVRGKVMELQLVLR